MAFLVSNVAMKNPGDAPLLPDLTKNLFLNFNAAIDSSGDGERVGTIIMRHGIEATPGDYTFNRLRGTGTHKPVSMVEDGESFLRFDGNSTLSNSSSDSTVISGAFTEAFRVRINDWASLSGNSGIRRGVPGYTAGYRSGGSIGVLSAAGGLTNAVWTNFSAGMQEGEWGVIVVSYDEINGSKVLSGSNNITAINITSNARIKGLGFGANNETTGTAGILDLSHYGLWPRALSSDEMWVLREIYQSRGDIQS